MNKIVLITGASHGIGLSTARQLLSEGYIVYGSARNEKASKELKKLGGHPVLIEMEDEKTMKSAVAKVIDEQGRIDILINDAGWGHYGPVEEIPIDTARKLMDINLFGLARLTQLVLPHMRKAGSGTIVNISSMAGKIYFPLGGWYHASKHAIEGLSDCLRVELEPLGIKVVIIEPGIIDTGFNEAMVGRIKDLKSTGAYDEIKNTMLRSIDPKNPGTKPEVIAKLVSKTLSKRKPKPRYYAGKLAGTVINVRRIFGDRAFDWMLRKQFGLSRKSK